MPAEPLLRVTSLRKAFQSRPVLHDLSLTVQRASILGVAGRSGSGKTTLARCLARFEKPDSGEILLDGRELGSFPRNAVQLIFQQPGASLNPRFTAGETVAEPLIIGKSGTHDERRRRVADAMTAVGLDPSRSNQPAMAFSGGERQRLAIARALAVEPKLLILDESLANLDLSIQAQVANLILDLRGRRGITFLVIAHDLTALARVADEIAILDAGSIVEHASTGDLMAHPRHALTRELVDANLALGSRP